MNRRELLDKLETEVVMREVPDLAFDVLRVMRRTTTLAIRGKMHRVADLDGSYGTHEECKTQ